MSILNYQVSNYIYHPLYEILDNILDHCEYAIISTVDTEDDCFGEHISHYKIDTFEAVQFTRYRNGGHYDWHRDLQESLISANGVMRKLSLTFCLSDPNKYEGGELQFYNGERPRLGYTLADGTKIEAEQIKEDIRSQGSVIVFDTRDWHRVTPVTKGTRYSIVCWTVGPNFV